MMFSLLDELGDLGKGVYQISDALLYVSLMFPTWLLEFFPMSVLIGALFGMGSMAANSELTVMRASGMTTWRIAGATIKASFILMVFVVIVGEWLSPVSGRVAQQIRTSAISGGDLSFSKTGLWAKKGQQIIQLGNVLSTGELGKITLYEMNEQNNLVSIVRAEKGQFDGHRWILHKVQEIKFQAEQVVTVNSTRKVWDNPLEDDQLETLVLEPESLNLLGLYNYLNYLSDNNMETREFELALWRKIMQPVSIAVMMFLAVSFIFGPMRSVSMGARILSGVLFGFVFYMANQSFGPISLVFNLPPFLGATLPLIVFAMLGYGLMKRNH